MLFRYASGFGLQLLGFAAALGLSLGFTYAVREHARRAGLFDPADERKLHTEPIPRVGGMAIFAAFALTLVALAALFGEQALRIEPGGRLGIVLAGAAAIHVLGLWDDVRNLRARWKFLAQIAIALAVFAGGVRVHEVSLPLVGVVHLGAAAGALFTVVWLVGITNAFNLIDGLDGLAAGAALFALTTMFVVAGINGQAGAGLVTLVLAGATLGFLYYNFHPASIFLGDSGSLFLGFMLAGIGLLSAQKSPTAVAVAIPVVSLGLPVLDTTLAIVRRFLRGQPIFSADRGHIHHRLLGLGHSPRKVALLLYGACAMLGLGGMLLVNNSAYVAAVLVVIGIGTGIAVQRLRFREFEELGRFVRRGVRPREVIGRNVRIREATATLGAIQDIGMLFGALERTFAREDFMRVEVRLRRSFVDRADARPLDRRIEDDVVVWSWNRNESSHADWWEIRLPFVEAGTERLGSLVLWQDGAASETSLSHVHVIARELRVVVQHKLVALWHDAERGAAVTLLPQRAPVLERVVPIETVLETTGEVPLVAAGVADGASGASVREPLVVKARERKAVSVTGRGSAA